MTDTLTSRSTLATPNASRYLQQLCKHFEHKLPVSYDASTGSIAFASGVCALTADADALTMVVTPTSPDTLAQVQDVVARHLVRFGFREDLTVVWAP